MATNTDEVALGVLVEKFEIFRQSRAKSLESLLDKALIVCWFLKLLSFVLVDNLDLGHG